MTNEPEAPEAPTTPPPKPMGPKEAPPAPRKRKFAELVETDFYCYEVLEDDDLPRMCELAVEEELVFDLDEIIAYFSEGIPP